MSHTEKLPSSSTARGAFDVAFRPTWIGAAEVRDVRYWTTIEPPELPWPLRFGFVQVTDDDGSRRWMVVGFELGLAIPRNADGTDADDYELSPQRIARVWENFHRYRRMAEQLLIPTPSNLAEAARTREAMRRRRRERLNDADSAVLLEEFRAREGEYGRTERMAAERGIHRSTLTRQIQRAKQREEEPF